MGYVFVCSSFSNFLGNSLGCLFEIFLNSYKRFAPLWTSLLGRKFLLGNFLLGNLLGKVVFSFVSKYFLVSSLISLLIHCFFNSMLVNLHVFILFCFSFSDWFLVSYSCGQKDVSNDFCFHKFIWTFFVTKLWSILGDISCIMKENVYSEGCFFFFFKI